VGGRGGGGGGVGGGDNGGRGGGGGGGLVFTLLCLGVCVDVIRWPYIGYRPRM